MIDIFTLQSASPNLSWLGALYTALLTFLLSALIGLTYIKTFRGLSFSRNYVQAIILGALIAATVMQAIGDSLARGLGMMGALAVIRFRTSFRDPKDIIFMFASLAAGIASGVGAHVIAVVGTLFFILVVVILHLTPLSETSTFDGLLRFNLSTSETNRAALDQILSAHCSKFALITLRDMNQGERLDFAYQVKFKKMKEKAEFVETLQKELTTIQGVSLMLQEATTDL